MYYLGAWRQLSAASPLATFYKALSNSHTSTTTTRLSITKGCWFRCLHHLSCAHGEVAADTSTTPCTVNHNMLLAAFLFFDCAGGFSSSLARPAVISKNNSIARAVRVSFTDSKRGRLPCGAPAGFVLVNVFIYTLAPPLRHST